MSCNTPLDPYCDAWPADDSIIPTDIQTQAYNQLFIKIEAEFMYPTAQLVEEDDLQIHAFDRVMEFSVPCDRLIDNNTSWSTISDMLSRVGVPLDNQPFMMHRVSACAHEMAHAVHNLGRKVLPMNMSIGVFLDLGDDQEEGDAIFFRESMEGIELKAVPAGSSSVEALGRVKIEDPDSINQCMICLEGLEVGSEATRMPCLHLYHGGCIINCLRVGNLCPLCRFQMPT